MTWGHASSSTSTSQGAGYIPEERRAKAGACPDLGRLALDSRSRGPRSLREVAVGMGTSGRVCRTVRALMRCLSAASFSAAEFCRRLRGQGQATEDRSV